ncbi:MAG TPA: GNAT family N-acetyltransferase [Acetobacteraceae bacterium]|jgi:ribosomal protein S18 acetylase RimI-like enzyme|nr:GNAT family N-acetyltransferase [Acetobacteraceae bacterium]
MQHTLDNPVWCALTGPQADLAIGHGLARHFPRDIAPFSAVAEPTAAAYADLGVDLPYGLEARLFRPQDEAASQGWETVSSRPIVQMVAQKIAAPPTTAETEFVVLGPDDAADMLALAGAAKPGPFGPRTSLLGVYLGVQRAGQLIAMGGERLRLPGFVELSGICVHPSARGTGLGAAITAHLTHMVLERGETPFLHVFPDNPAIALYARLGFFERAQFFVLWHRRLTERPS